MTVKTLYRYEREEGKITVSTEKPDCKYTKVYRLIADEDKLITKDGEELYICLDVEDREGWYEVDAPEEEEAEEYDSMGN